MSPCIVENTVFLDLSKKFPDKSLRLVLSVCDFKFLEKYFNRLLAYEEASILIPMVVGVYSSRDNIQELKERLADLKRQYSLKKVYFFVFYCDKLEWVLSQQQGSEIKWDYKVNYIRNARYNLVAQIWNITGLENAEKKLKDSSIYVIDFDNQFKGDLNSAIKKEFGDSKIVFSWNSGQSPNKKFPDSLSASGYVNNKYSTNHPYKVIKAGFTAFAPNSLSRQFLWLFKNYTIGDNASLIFMRLFNFYYSDQIGILLALLEIKAFNSDFYRNNISWIDIKTSPIVNLNESTSQIMWYPKGINFFNK